MSSKQREPMNAPVTNPRGRKRSVAAQTAILTAASELLEKKCLRDVTAEAIAERAGTSKATIYKWWPNKNHVALDAFLLQTQAQIPTSDTGCALRDFTEQLVLATRFYKSPRGRLLTQFIAEGQSDPELLRLFRERFLRQRRLAVTAIWQKAVDRGDIRDDVDSELFIDLLFSPLVYRLLVGHNPLTDADAEAIVHAVFRGVRVPCDKPKRRV
jgi:AcrR family transcriptional regulator